MFHDLGSTNYCPDKYINQNNNIMPVKLSESNKDLEKLPLDNGVYEKNH